MTAAAEEAVIRFEVRHGMRRVSCAVSNDALDAASGLTDAGTPAERRRSFDRFRTVIHAAALLRLEARPLGSMDPIVLTGRDLRIVPPHAGAPKFGAVLRPTGPAPHPHAEGVPGDGRG